MRRAKQQLGAALALLAAGTVGCETTWQRGWTQQAPISDIPMRDQEVARMADQTPAVEVEVGDNGKAGAARADVLAFIERLEKAEKASQQPTTPNVDPAAPRLAKDKSPALSFARSDMPPVKMDVRVVRADPVMAKEPALVPPRVLQVWIGESEAFAASEDDPSSALSELASAPVANMPVTAEDRGSSRTLDEGARLLADLEEQAAADPDNEELQWRLALVRLAFGKSDCSAGKGLSQSKPSSSLLRKSICTLAAAKRAVEDPIMAIDDALASVDELRAELRGRAVLTIPTLALCTKVQAFGVYEELPDGFLRAFARNQAIAYFEVGNFTSEQMPDGRFRTLLSDRFEILTPEGESIWRHEEPEIEDLSRRRREDFFVAQRIVIPPSIGEGSYVLKVTVEDRLADTQTQAVLHFNIAASLARSTRR